MSKQHLGWIDIVKVLAATMIMTAHFQDAALDACRFPPAVSGVYNIINTILVPLQNGKFWVMVFCIVSGYLGCKKVGNFRELILEAFSRYLRFFLPLLLCNSGAYAIFRMGGYASVTYGEMFGNSWISSHYSGNYTPVTVLIQSLIFGARLNSTLWMLRPLFIGNLLILTVNYLSGKVSEKFQKWMESSVFVLFVLGGFFSAQLLYVAATYAGLLIKNNQKPLLSRRCIAPVLGLIYIVYLLPAFFPGLGFINQPRVDLVMGLLFSAVFFFSGVVGPVVRRVNLGSLSFWIFLLHSPLLCSLGLGIVMRNLDNFWPGFLLAMAVLVGVVYALSLLLSRWFDPAVGRLIQKIRAVVYR